ncbi:MAG: hypothetical protein K2Q18_10955 [Bdellovibrionales bacterium]|nr:hypothetical protein [Bdellovibrionales bacterium]
MNKILFLTSLILLGSCASHTPKDSRKVASEASEATPVVAANNRDITGTFLAVADYKSGRVGPNKAAARIYFHELENEKGKYNAVLLEYVNLLKIAPKYVASNKLPKLAKKTGFLNSITQNISAYRVEPTEKEGVFEMYPLVVVGDKIEPKRDVKPRILTLSADEGRDALAGATISQSRDDEPKEIFFPSDDDEKKTGLQYKMAKLTYAKAKLESTWRKNFLTGPYLSQYANVDDVVLELSGSGDAQVARFIINEKMAAKVSHAKREAIFTNKKSAFLKGDYSVSEPQDGMFLLAPVNSEKSSNEILNGRIGLFIDVFDATKSLNQDVVELAFIDSEHPEDFLMYYEHPDNGEGTNNLR